MEKRPPGKTRVTIRLDDDVLEHFREQVHAAGGRNDQAMTNAALRERIQVRRVLREELCRAA